MDSSNNAENYFNGTFSFGGDIAAQSIYSRRTIRPALPPQSSFVQVAASQYGYYTGYQQYQQQVPAVQQPFAVGALQYVPQSQMPVNTGMTQGYPHPQMPFYQGIQQSHLSFRAGVPQQEVQQGHIYSSQELVHADAPLCFCDTWGHPCNPNSVFFCPGSYRAQEADAAAAAAAAAAAPQRQGPTSVSFGELLRSDTPVLPAGPKDQDVVDNDIVMRAGPPALVDLTGQALDNSAAPGGPDGPIDLTADHADDVEIVGTAVARRDSIDLTNEDAGEDQVIETAIRESSQPPREQNQEAAVPVTPVPRQYTPSEADKEFMKGYKKRYGKHLGLAARAQTAECSRISGLANWTAGQIAYNAASQFLEKEGASNRAPEHSEKQVREQVYEGSSRDVADGPESGSAMRRESRDPDVAMTDAHDPVVAADDEEHPEENRGAVVATDEENQREENSAGNQIKSIVAREDPLFDDRYLVDAEQAEFAEDSAEYGAQTNEETHFGELVFDDTPEMGIGMSEAQAELVLAPTAAPESAQLAKRPRGRPKGSKNRTPEQKAVMAAEKKAATASKPKQKKRKSCEEDSVAKVDAENGIGKPQLKRPRNTVPVKSKKEVSAPVCETKGKHKRAEAPAGAIANSKAYYYSSHEAAISTAESSLVSSQEATLGVEDEPVVTPLSNEDWEALFEKIAAEQDSAALSASMLSPVAQIEAHVANSAAIAEEHPTVPQPILAEDSIAPPEESIIGNHDDINALFDGDIEEHTDMILVAEEEVTQEEEGEVAQLWAEKKVAAESAIREEAENIQHEMQQCLEAAHQAEADKMVHEEEAALQAQAKAEAEAAKNEAQDAAAAAQCSPSIEEDALIVKIRQSIANKKEDLRRAPVDHKALHRIISRKLAAKEAELETRLKELQGHA